MLAWNGVAEFEYAFDFPKRDLTPELEATPLSMYFGYLYNFTPRFALGFEALNHYEIVTGSGREHAAFFCGPTLYWSVKKSFFALNFLPQIANLDHEHNPSTYDLDEYERYNIRLLFGLGL